MVAAYRTFGSFEITGLIDEEIVGVLPKSLRFLAHCGMYLFFLVLSGCCVSCIVCSRCLFAVCVYIILFPLLLSNFLFFSRIRVQEQFPPSTIKIDIHFLFSTAIPSPPPPPPCSSF